MAALKSADPASVEPLLAGLAAGWPADKKPILDEAAQADFAALAGKLPPAGLLQLADAGQALGPGKENGGADRQAPRVGPESVADAKLPDDARLAAAHDLLSLGGDEESLKAVLDQIGPQSGPALTAGLFDVLADSTSEAVGPAVVKRWPQLTPAGRGAAVDLLLKRPAWTNALLDAVEKGGVDKADLSVEQAQRLSRYPDDGRLGTRAKKLLAGGRRIAQSGSPKGGGCVPAGAEAARRRREGQGGFRAELRQVSPSRRPGRQHRPRPDWHGRP